jgi:hypothetical protein
MYITEAIVLVSKIKQCVDQCLHGAAVAVARPARKEDYNRNNDVSFVKYEWNTSIMWDIVNGMGCLITWGAPARL